MATGSIREKKMKNGDIHFQITVEGPRDPLTGKRVRAYKNVDGSMREAKALMHQMITEMDRNKAGKQSKINVSDWMDEWFRLYLPNIAETTRIGYKSKISCYIKPMLGHILIKSLRTEHVQGFVNELMERGLAPKSIREAYNNLNAAMKKAVVLRMIQYNPCEGVVLPKQKRYKAQIYDVETIRRLLDVAEGTDMYIPLLILVTTGLRRGELLALKWSDIDFDKGVLMVRNNMVRGANGPIIKAPKSTAGIRDIHLGEDVLLELKKAYKDYLHKCTFNPRHFNNSGFVVCQDDGSPLMPDSMTQKWERFIEINGFPHIRLHDLRHSNASALIQAGENPKVVQERLGHSDVSITLNTYTHVTPDMDIRAAEKLDRIMLRKA